MPETTLQAPAARRPLRLWPGVLLAVLVLLARYVMPEIAPDWLILGMLAGVLGPLLILLWWLLFSRAAWSERLLALVVLPATLLGTYFLLDRSIATGAMGMLFPFLALPIVGVAFVAWAVLTRRMPDGVRRATMVATILLSSGALALVRTGGFTGEFKNDLALRWTATPEERLLAAEPVPAPAPAPPSTPAPAPAPVSAPLPTIAATPAAVPVTTPATLAPATAAVATPPSPIVMPVRVEWPGFRGPGRNGVVSGTRVSTDWTATPPVAVWKRAIGPGWSSFAVAGDRIYTQEQRGEDELVACYSTSTGAPVWQHRDRARFWESNAGAGPRGTPLVHDGRVYALGATGILNALDAARGSVVWTHDVAEDTGAKRPDWGFAGSPIAVDGLLIAPASGALAAYELASGRLRWKTASRGEGYTSPTLVTLDGVRQLLFVSGAGIAGVAPADGTILWSHAWKGYPMVQPQAVADGGVVLAVNESDGLRKLTITHADGRWTAAEAWTSRGLKPYFSDFVVHRGHAYGFDGGILACVDLADGTRTWKGGRYGSGQLVLLADQDALLVIAEEGDVALVKASPDAFTELARQPGLDGKTWNHPVVVGDRLLVRNGEQMAAFRLPTR